MSLTCGRRQAASILWCWYIDTHWKYFHSCISLTCSKWKAASGKYVMMLAYWYTLKIFSFLYKFDMRQVADGKGQVHYDNRIETSKEYMYFQCISLICGMLQAATGNYIRFANWYKKRKYFQCDCLTCG